jgi:hypothetical protein
MTVKRALSILAVIFALLMVALIGSGIGVYLIKAAYDYYFGP